MIGTGYGWIDKRDGSTVTGAEMMEMEMDIELVMMKGDGAPGFSYPS